MQVRARCDSPMFRGGVLIAHGATVQPARLARGLRRVLMERGCASSRARRSRGSERAAPRSPRRRLARFEPPHAVIALGRVGARTWKRFRPRAHRSAARYIVITAPAPDRARGARMDRTARRSATIALVGALSAHHARRTHRVRARRACNRASRGRSAPRFAFDEAVVRGSTATTSSRCSRPSQTCRSQRAWGGPIDVSGAHDAVLRHDRRTRERAPRVGYTGNGVGPSHLGGKILATLATGADDALARLPVVTREPKRFPPEPLRSPGMLVANAAIWRKDDLEDAGVGADPLTRLVATMPRRLGYDLGPR